MTEQTTEPHKLTSRVKLLQKVVLWHQRKCLILRRSPDSTSRPNLWDLPGGNAEWPADTTQDIRHPHTQDALREVLEETGVVVGSDLENCYVGSYFAAADETYTILLGWKVELPSTFDIESVKISNEHTEFAWINPEQFDAYDFGFAGNEDGFIRQIIFG